MRIVFAADAYKPYVSGVTLYMSQHKEALEKLGHTVHLVTFGDSHSPPEAGVYYNPGFRLKMGFTFGLHYAKAALDILHAADIIHLHHPFISGQLVLKAVRQYPAPLFFTVHTRYDEYVHDYIPWLPQAMGAGILKMYMPRFCSRMTGVICNSAASEQGIRNCGVTRRVERVPNGIHLTPFLTARKNAILRKQLGGDRQVLFLSVGRLSVDKNIPLLLEAFAKICSLGHSVHLAMVGGGPFAARLAAMVARLGIEDRVTFTGPVPHAELPEYYASADAFVIASIHDTHPLVVLEAMGAGLPLAVVDSLAYRDLVFDRENGYVTQNNAGSFSEAMGALASSPDDRHRMGQRSQELSANFGVERTAQALVGLYQSALEANPRP